MLRLLIFLAVICAIAFGVTWLADNPGEVDVTWRGMEYDFSLMVALGMVLASRSRSRSCGRILRYVLRAPSLISLASRMRRREKGFNALSRGMIAVGSGDARAAQSHAAEARKLLADEPLTKLLARAVGAARGDRQRRRRGVQRNARTSRRPMRSGLRGLHVEARRRGDHEAALDYAARAHKYAALPWAAQAVLDDRAAHGDWAGALATVESNAAPSCIDKPTANRWRAVLKTAIALETAERDPKGALALAQEALRAGARPRARGGADGRLTAARGRLSPRLENHRDGVSSRRRIPNSPPSICACATAIRAGSAGPRARAGPRRALRHREPDDDRARRARRARSRGGAARRCSRCCAAIPGSRAPTVRICLLTAEIEEAEGNHGAVREWLNRAARAPRDRAWVADGVISDHWAPVSPSGVIDGFVWKTPDERLTALVEPPPRRPQPSRRRARRSSRRRPRCPRQRQKAPPRRPRLKRRLRTAMPASDNVVRLPSAAPDDPGPPRPEGKPGFRLFASE